MFYTCSFWGMHFIWWFFWIILLLLLLLLLWIFAIPYDIPGQRNRKDSPLYILQKRFAAGEITKEEYEEKKKILEADRLKS